MTVLHADLALRRLAALGARRPRAGPGRPRVRGFRRRAARTCGQRRRRRQAHDQDGRRLFRPRRRLWAGARRGRRATRSPRRSPATRCAPATTPTPAARRLAAAGARHADACSAIRRSPAFLSGRFPLSPAGDRAMTEIEFQPPGARRAAAARRAVDRTIEANAAGARRARQAQRPARRRQRSTAQFRDRANGGAACSVDGRRLTRARDADLRRQPGAVRRRDRRADRRQVPAGRRLEPRPAPFAASEDEPDRDRRRPDRPRRARLRVHDAGARSLPAQARRRLSRRRPRGRAERDIAV